MILKLIKEKDLKEAEVQIKYAEMNGQVKVLTNKKKIFTESELKGYNN